MDLVSVRRGSSEKMMGDVAGMKTLLLDRETSAICGMVYSKTEFLKLEVFDIDMLHDRSKRTEASDMKCAVFVRPTEENVRHLCDELRNPKFSAYHLFFSNIVQPNQERKRWIEEIASADESGLVQQVFEVYGDYFAVNDQTFTLNCPFSAPLGATAAHPVVDRVVDGIVSLLLSLKKLPVIKYLSTSAKAVRIAKEVGGRIQQEGELFSFRQRRQTAPVLLILDRREDPVTPLLKQWTYQAMTHELIGINNNVVDLSKCPGGKKDIEELVLDPRTDPFYAQNRYLNFGELGENIKQLVDEYQASTPVINRSETASIEDLQSLIQDVPEIRRKCGVMTKHVALVFEFKRQTETRMLMETSQVEQDLACTQDHASACEQVANLLHNPRVTPADALRLVLLYHLRYEQNTTNQLREFKDLLKDRGVQPPELAMVAKLMRFAGGQKRSFDIFENRDTMARLRSFVKQPLKDIKNVYTQHTPLLGQILNDCFQGKLDPSIFPTIGGSRAGGPLIPEEVIVFIAGGTTYEEALCVHNFNEEMAKAGRNARVILGGTYIHNSTTFLEELDREFQDIVEEEVVMDNASGKGKDGGSIRSRFGGGGSNYVPL